MVLIVIFVDFNLFFGVFFGVFFGFIDYIFVFKNGVKLFVRVWLVYLFVEEFVLFVIW